MLVYKSADISDADLLIRIYNSAFYDDFIRYGQCQAYGQSREEMEKSVKVFPKIIAYAQDKPVGVISYKAEGLLYWLFGSSKRRTGMWNRNVFVESFYE